ncbi:4103_t:CDS:2 [Cetraspora pellucida]|uniref:4103_t:CDS:1 n=1 Tax=Cetraspora pellucida TaxID=1433469 RepID=A0ACA9LWC5_9GLOM|nr:4103_t:CDS:2 [Cetraspora pellucida]
MAQNSEKIVQYLQSDATPLSDDKIQDIINARNLMKQHQKKVVSQLINIGSISSTKTNQKKKIQSSSSSYAVKKNASPIDNTSRRKDDLEKLMKDTKRLASILLSLSQ